MNPRQEQNNQPANSSPSPSTQSAAYIPDVADAAFDFADVSPQVPSRPVTQPSPAPRPPVVAPARPVKQSAPQQPTTPIAPTPPLPANPSQITPMPADVLPPQKIPATPTLQPLAPPPIAEVQSSTATSPLPVQASSPPITATFSPSPSTHLPDDIAARIAETPMQSSSDVNRIITGKGKSRFKSILSFVGFAIAIFVAAFLINQFIFQSYYVEGTSMTPTLQNNDRLIISKVERTIAGIQGKPYIPERGQVVVLDSSIVGLNGQKEQLIKRVIGLPGDKIHIENGTVTITDDQYPTGVDITKTLGLTNLQPTYSDAVIDLTVPKNQVYVMGDNREQGGSYDSRSFGPIDGDKIQGRLWARILPFDKAQIF